MNLSRCFLCLFFFLPAFLSAQNVWPGDVNNNGVVNEVDLLYLGLGFGETGPARKVTSAAWQAQTATSTWTTSVATGLDLTFADCNGDGLIDNQDIAVIEQNFGLTHADVVFQPDEIPQGIVGQSPGFSVLSEDLFIRPDTKAKEVQIGLGDSQIPVESLLGISFYIKANPKAFNIETTDFSFDSNGWLGTDNAAVLKRVAPGGRSASGDFIVAYSRINRLPSSGNGLIGTLTLNPSFIFEGDVPDLKVVIDSIVLIDEQREKTAVLGTEINFQLDRFTDSTFVDFNMCNGDALVFAEQTLTETGTYQDTLQNALGGDSLVILDLTVLDPYHVLLETTICSEESYLFNGQSYSTTGIYRDTFTAANGCDSILTLDLTVFENTETRLERMICAGERIEFNGLQIENAGEYRDTVPGANGCNRYIILTLEVLDTLQTQIDRTICEGESILFNNQMLRTAGTYRDTLQAANGCSQFVVLNLDVAPISTTYLEETICAGESYDFNGQNLSVTGLFSDTLQTYSGCDSIVQLSLTVRDQPESETAQMICQGDSLLFYGFVLTSPNSYSVVLTSSSGCDSLVVLNLSVEERSIIQIDSVICPGESMTFFGNDYSDSGTYYHNNEGCEQTVLNLTVAENCQSVSAEEQLLQSIEIYPNPVRESFTIRSPNMKLTNLVLLNTTGQILRRHSFSNGMPGENYRFDLDGILPGVYWVLISTEYGLRQERIIKL